MAKRHSKDVSSWLSKSTSPPDLQRNVVGAPFMLDKELLAAKSAKFAALLKGNSQEDLSHFLRNIPADTDTLELVARFYHGFEVQISTENVVPLICVAHYLEMTENHSTNNLLDKAVSFFQEIILPSWNETVKAFRTTEKFLQQSLKLGLVEACMESMIKKALADPRLLGEPLKNLTKYGDDSDDDDEGYKPNARRRLFVLDWQSEDLATLSLQLYEPVIHEMNKHGVPSNYVAASLCTYAKKWVLSSIGKGVKRDYQRKILEAVEKLLPHEKGLIPCTLMFEILRFAIVLEVSSECRNGIEIRIGKQLDQATVEDLLIPSQGYSKEVQYDIDCVRRIVRVFYGSYTSSDISGLIAVAELVEEFFTEAASDIDLKIETFVALAEMSLAASLGVHRTSDGVYRAVDIYLDKHRHLTESEREEVCQVLDFKNMSPEACEHASKNEKLPLRVVVQVLFAGQLQLRDTIMKEVQGSDDKSTKDEAEENEKNLDSGEEEMKSKMEKLSIKVMELERGCCMMRKELENGCSLQIRKEKPSLWREMKRKFGCITSVRDSNCQSKKKKVHPKFGW